MVTTPKEPKRTPGQAEGSRTPANEPAHEPGRTSGSAEGERLETGRQRGYGATATLQPTKTVFTRAEAESLFEQGAEAVFLVLESLSQELVHLRTEVKALEQQLKDKW